MTQESTSKEALRDYALEPVPLEKRRSLFGTFTVWAGWVMSITAFLVGGLVGGGLPLSKAIPAIVLGNFVLACVGTLMGYLGYKTGISTYLISRLVFGKRGSLIISAYIGFLAMGFVGVFAGATGTFIQGYYKAAPLALGAFVFTVMVVSTALYGFKGLEYLSKIAVPLMWLLAILGLWKVSQTVPGGLGAVAAVVPEKSVTFWFGMTLAISTWITGASMTADVGRYAKKSWHVAAGAFGGWLCGAAFLECISAVTALAIGQGDVVLVMIELGLFWPAIIIFFAAMWTSGDNNLYSFSLAFSNFAHIFKKEDTFTKPRLVFIGGVIVFIGAVLGLYAQFRSFLLTIAITVPPIAGVFISKLYLTGRYKSTEELTKQLEKAPSMDYIAFAAWIVGAAVAYFYKAGSPALNGLVVSVVVYYILRVVAKK
ncbi:MAG: cytosine permease [Theionarchaea archaeon]|nr:MAG: hypothetical protein AYK19_04030 [Theionarchaea archaeon DG-70-1]MBU7027084.1 cytosine permease [Theionarchaea archaeon]